MQNITNESSMPECQCPASYLCQLFVAVHCLHETSSTSRKHLILFCLLCHSPRFRSINGSRDNDKNDNYETKIEQNVWPSRKWNGKSTCSLKNLNKNCTKISQTQSKTTLHFKIHYQISELPDIKLLTTKFSDKKNTHMKLEQDIKYRRYMKN